MRERYHVPAAATPSPWASGRSRGSLGTTTIFDGIFSSCVSWTLGQCVGRPAQELWRRARGMRPRTDAAVEPEPTPAAQGFDPG